MNEEANRQKVPHSFSKLWVSKAFTMEGRDGEVRAGSTRAFVPILRLYLLHHLHRCTETWLVQRQHDVSQEHAWAGLGGREVVIPR